MNAENQYPSNKYVRKIDDGNSTLKLFKKFVRLGRHATVPRPLVLDKNMICKFHVNQKQEILI